MVPLNASDRTVEHACKIGQGFIYCVSVLGVTGTREQLSLDLTKTSELGFSYNHISNASLGDKNPGANSYMFNFLKKF